MDPKSSAPGNLASRQISAKSEELSPNGWQLVASQYIDPAKLIHKLKDKFGEGTYEVEMRHNKYMIHAKGELTEDDIKACHY
ncbi:hypothetical protein F5Y06DRAFT_266603 [Hypoxylon sp. FL0890]|nr:hypothetical protein F5Y06DRAFT_266603 [Hypoxylon sp. FL0890]